MDLTQYVAPRKSITVPGCSEALEVEGLSLSSLAILVQTHMADLDAVFDLFVSGAETKPDQIADFLGSVIMQAPGLAANIIAVAAGQPKGAPNVEKMPFSVQLDILMAVGDLTFTEPGSVKKFMEQVAMLMKKTTIEKITKAQPTAKKRR